MSISLSTEFGRAVGRLCFIAYFIRLKVSKRIMIRIPIKAIANKYSATLSKHRSMVSFEVRMEKKENKQEKISSTAIAEVSSSIVLLTE